MGQELPKLRAMRNHPAYAEGRNAFNSGQPHTDNPHPDGSEQQTQWGFGWLETKNTADYDAMRKFMEQKSHLTK